MGFPRRGKSRFDSVIRKHFPFAEHADTLSLNSLRGLVTGLLERSQQAAGGLEKLEAETTPLREANAALGLENAQLKVENPLLRDESNVKREMYGKVADTKAPPL